MSARRFLRPLCLILVLAALPVAAQEGAPPPRVNREQMWPAPTAEDWKKPCLVTWQRTWEDAVRVSEETRKPILVCVNMDGEIASEHYAGVRYRSPEIASLYEPYVTVIASVYRHNPRDYDDEGRRILCPRFGSVTCGEHIAIEPIIYEKFLDGQRIAPRHIMVELDGTEKYDVFYRNDTASVFDDIRKGIAERTIKPKTVVRGDRPVVERVASPDIADRQAVENAWLSGDAAIRKALLDAARKMGPDAPLELLRLAVFGLDPDLSKAARKVLAESGSAAAVDLIVEALKVPMDEADRTALIAALDRHGEASPRARWLAVVHEGLSSTSSAVDPKGWLGGGSEYRPAAPKELGELELARDGLARARAEAPEDGATLIDLAEASLGLAMKSRQVESQDPAVARMFTRHMYEEARRSAELAARHGAPAWRVDTVIALVAYYRGDLDEAYERAAAAVAALPPGEPGWNAMAVLTVFAEGRYKAIKQAAKEGRRWPAKWLADVDAAYTALLGHPLATDSQVDWHYDFLLWLGAQDRAMRFLTAALDRFPESSILHARLRDNLLANRGAAALEAAYGKMLAAKGSSGSLEWFAGYAALLCAEYERRGGRRTEAVAAYGLAIERFTRSAEALPEFKDGADHYAALALAGRARLAMEDGDFENAVKGIVAAFELRPASAATKDGLSLSPAATARTLLARLTEQNLTDPAATLKAAMDKLDPALLIPED
jgi:tetratricopeptide (TPR) repeat protein